MNTFDLLPLQENMAQRGAGAHDKWQSYMTVLVVNHGIIESISILTVFILPMLEYDVDEPWNASARKYSGCWPFVSSFRLSLRWI